MNFKTHVIGGISAGVILNETLLHHFNVSDNATSPLFMSSLFIAGSVVGSLLPDVDHRGSYFGRRAKIVSLPLNVLAGHRGITHTPILLMAIVSLLLFLSKTCLSGAPQLNFSYMSIGLGIGMASHILLDSLTKGGVPLLYPFSQKKFSFLPIKTGGLTEKVIAMGIIVGTFFIWAGKHLSFFFG